MYRLLGRLLTRLWREEWGYSGKGVWVGLGTAIVIGGGLVYQQVATAGQSSAPTAPPNLTATSITSTSVTIGWGDSTDDVGVVNYRIYRDTAFLGEGPGTSGGFSNSWADSGRTCNTSYTYAVEAQDALGNTSPQSTLVATTLACSGDTTPPSVTLTAPANGATVSSTITVSATASDNVGVTQVEFLRSGGVFATDTSSPYSTTFDTTTIPNGNYAFTARASDAAGNTTTSSAATVTVSNAGGGAAVLAVSTTGNDSTCVRGNTSLPCLTLDRARDLASCGDTVNIAAGTYGSAQTVTGSPTSCSTNPVLFTVPSGPATFTGAITLNVAGMRLTGITFTQRMTWNSTCNGCQLYNSVGPSMDVYGSDNNQLVGNTLGPASPTCTHANIFIWPGNSTDPSDGWLISGNTFQNFQCADPHSEALFIAAYARNGLIENNIFTNNGNTGHIFWTWCSPWNDCNTWGGGYKDPTNWCTRNNTFYDTWTAFYAIDGRAELTGNPSLNVFVDQDQTVTGPVITPGAGGGSNLAQLINPPLNSMLVASCVDPRSSDSTPPTVSLTAPANGASVGGTITLTATASDNVGVTQVAFLRAGNSFDTDTSSPYSTTFDTTTVANGSHTFAARASDAAGNQTTSAGATVTVSNGGGGGTTRYVSTGGSDSNSCTSGSPCLTIDRAYDLSACGHTIQIAGGTYGPQTISGQPACSATWTVGTFRGVTCTSCITATVASGATVTLGGLSLNGARYFSIQRGSGTALNVGGGGIEGSTTNNIVLRDVAWTSTIFVNGPSVTGYDNIAIVGGSMGPLTLSSSNCCGIYLQTGSAGTTGTDFVVDNVNFTGFQTNLANDPHSEIIRVDGGWLRTTIRNSTFTTTGTGVTTAVIFVTNVEQGGSDPTDVVLENNYFGQQGNAFVTFDVHANVSSCATFRMRYNTFYGANADLSCTTTGMQWIGNIGPKGFTGCDGTYTRNVWQHNVNVACGSDTWVNGPAYSVGNLGLGGSNGFELQASSPAIQAGETANCPATDHDGNTRPNPGATNCDAGGHERNT